MDWSRILTQSIPLRAFGAIALLALTVLALPVHLRGAEGIDVSALSGRVRAVVTTNSTKALALCDRALVEERTNAGVLLLRARVRDFRREYDEANRDATEALRIDPSFAGAWQLRGEVNFKARRFRASVADFDKFLDLVPAQKAQHWQRGISLYYAGEFEEGRKQFELHQTVNPNDVENAVWHFLCAARAGSVEAARRSYLKVGPDGRIPMAEVNDLFAGRGKAADVLDAAQRGSPERRDAQLFYAHLYLGLYYGAVQDRSREREHIFKAEQLAPKHYMGDVARVHASQLRDDKLP